MAETDSVLKPAHTGAPTRLAWLARRKEMLLLLVLAAAGFILVLSNTRLGAYLSDDTYYYIYPARDFAAGKGFNPSYIFAPMLPAVLAVASMFGLDVLVAVRWLNAALFGVNLFLVAQITRQITKAPGFPLLAAALVLCADVVVEAHGWAMSEALAFTLMLLSIYCALLYIRRGQVRYGVFAALFSALTILTRYAALPLVPAIALILLLVGPQKQILFRLRSAFLYGAASLLPVVVYWLRNQLTAGHPVRYQQFMNVPLDRGQIVWFLYNWFCLFIPGRFIKGREILAGTAITAAALLIAAVIWWWYRKAWGQVGDRVSSAGLNLCAAFLALNGLMLFLARGLTELDVFNPRYLVPMLIVFLILLVALAGQFWLVAGRWVRVGIIGLLALFLVYYAYRTYDFSKQVARMGLGYSNNGWHDSETVSYLRSNPDLVNMVSTGEMGIYFWTGRKPIVLADFATPQALDAYLCANDAPLFIMDQMPTDIYGMAHDDVVKGLTLTQRFNDSEMYRCPLKK